MFPEIDLKNAEYLKSYEEQIRKLPLDELEEILDIIKKDPSPERINIVNKRIQELEGYPEKEEPQEFPEIKFKLIDETQIEDNEEDKKEDTFEIEPPSSNYYKGKLSELELAEARLFAHSVDEKYKNAPPEPPPSPKRHTPASILFNWFLFVLFFGNWVFVNTKGGYFIQKGALIHYPEHDISYSITTASYFCLVVCFIIVRCYKKEASIGLSIASFFWIKSFLGGCEGIYPGFFVTPSESLSRLISLSILILTSLYVIKVATSKEKSYLKMTLIMVILCLAIEQIGWLG
jgi:hypothetical protein